MTAEYQPVSLCEGFSLCSSAYPSLLNQLRCFWESQPVIRALISRTSCLQLPEVGAGQEGSKVNPR